MDEKKDDKPTAPVMDVVPPKSASNPTPAPAPTTDTVVSSGAQEAPVATEPAQSDDAPAPVSETTSSTEGTTSPEGGASSEAPVDAPVPAPEQSNDSQDQAPAKEEGSEPTIADTANAMAIAPTAEKKPGAPKGAVIAAIVVAILLAAAAVAAYLKTNGKDDTATPAKQSTTQQSTNSTAAPKAATPSDVDSTNKEVDDAINSADESTDFNSSDLNDATLGL